LQIARFPFTFATDICNVRGPNVYRRSGNDAKLTLFETG
jgi:hypothetical protein